jgi:hypothetical protein
MNRESLCYQYQGIVALSRRVGDASSNASEKSGDIPAALNRLGSVSSAWQVLRGNVNEDIVDYWKGNTECLCSASLTI